MAPHTKAIESARTRLVNRTRVNHGEVHLLTTIGISLFSPELPKMPKKPSASFPPQPVISIGIGLLLSFRNPGAVGNVITEAWQGVESEVRLRLK
jgi:hypothetical protein